MENIKINLFKITLNYNNIQLNNENNNFKLKMKDSYQLILQLFFWILLSLLPFLILKNYNIKKIKKNYNILLNGNENLGIEFKFILKELKNNQKINLTLKLGRNYSKYEIEKEIYLKFKIQFFFKSFLIDTKTFYYDKLIFFFSENNLISNSIILFEGIILNYDKIIIEIFINEIIEDIDYILINENFSSKSHMK